MLDRRLQRVLLLMLLLDATDLLRKILLGFIKQRRRDQALVELVINPTPIGPSLGCGRPARCACVGGRIFPNETSVGGDHQPARQGLLPAPILDPATFRHAARLVVASPPALALELVPIDHLVARHHHRAVGILVVPRQALASRRLIPLTEACAESRVVTRIVVDGSALTARLVINATAVRTRINLTQLPPGESTCLFSGDPKALKRPADVLARGRLQRLGLALLPAADVEASARGRALQRCSVTLAATYGRSGLLLP